MDVWGEEEDKVRGFGGRVASGFDEVREKIRAAAIESANTLNSAVGVTCGSGHGPSSVDYLVSPERSHALSASRERREGRNSRQQRNDRENKEKRVDSGSEMEMTCLLSPCPGESQEK